MDFPQIAWVSFLLASTLLFFGPLYLYLTNVDEFNIGLSDVLPFQALLTLILSTVVAAAFFVVPRRFFRSLLILVASCGFLFWLQGQVIVWKYGALDGQDIVWSRHFFKGVLDGAIWIAFFALAAAFRRRLFPWVQRISVFFILLQAGSLLLLFLKSPAAWEAKPTPGIARYRYNFSREKNVLLLVLDEFQSDVFAEIVSQDQDYLSLFDGFTYFRDSIGSFTATAAAMPFLLTGRYYDNSERRARYIKRSFTDHSIPRKLWENGFRLDMYPRPDSNDLIYLPESWLEHEPRERISWRAKIPPRAFLIDITMFRYVPHFFKPLFYQRQEWLLRSWARRIFPDTPESGLTGTKPDSRTSLFPGFGRELVQLGLDFNFLNSFLRHAEGGSPGPVFKYYHWNAVHPPLRFDENFQIVRPESNRANFTSQAKACLKMVGLVLGKLKELDVYDQTLMIILSDHGSGRSKDMLVNPLFNDHSRSLSWGNPHQDFHYIKSRASALLLVKPMHARGTMKTNWAPVSHLDVAPTIFKELGIAAPTFSGESVLSIPEHSRRSRFFYSYSWDGYHKDFLQPLVEYRIDGDCRHDASWSLTGRVLTAHE